MSKHTISRTETERVYSIIGRRLATKRRTLWIKQSDIAKSIGTNPSMISLIETGQRRISLADALRYADLVGMPYCELFSEIDGKDLV